MKRHPSLVVLGLLAALLALPHLSCRRPEDVRVVVHAAYGSPSEIYVLGRALEMEERGEPGPDDSVAENLLRLAGDLETDEVPGLRLLVGTGGRSVEVRTDDEGFFEASLAAPGDAPFSDWTPPKIRITGVLFGSHSVEAVTVRPIVVPPGCLVVVSDIDDTILDSRVTEKLSGMERSLLRNAYQLDPVPGTAALYWELHHSHVPPVLVAYLSGSPVNLYDRLRLYLEHNDFPKGPMFLKNLGTGNADPLRDQEGYKTARLRLLMERLPEARFLLLGDSGQADAAVYATIAREHPERVVASLLRQVDLDSQPPQAEGIVFTRDAAEAASALVALGVLDAAAAARVRAALAD